MVNLSQLSEEEAILGAKMAPLYISLFSPEQRQWPSKLSGDSTSDFYDTSTLRWGQKEGSLYSRQCHERRVVGEVRWHSIRGSRCPSPSLPYPATCAGEVAFVKLLRARCWVPGERHAE